MLRKLDLPPVVIEQVLRRVVKREHKGAPTRLRLEPASAAPYAATMTVHTLAEQQATPSVLQQVGAAVTIAEHPQTMDVYAAAVALAGRYRLDVWTVYDEVRRLYPAGDVPRAHLDELASQVEAQTSRYTVETETVEVALVRREGFERATGPEGAVVYTAEIVYPREREALLLSWEQMRAQNSGGFGFHYSPYNFDSNPEKYFFEQVLAELKLHPDQVEDIYFTGALTDAAKTDFRVQYQDQHGQPRSYSPDFVMRLKPPTGGKPGSGRAYIVEIKREHDRAHPDDGENGTKAMAVRKWVGLNPERLRYEMIFTDSDTVPADRLDEVRKFVEGPNPPV